MEFFLLKGRRRAGRSVLKRENGNAKDLFGVREVQCYALSERTVCAVGGEICYMRDLQSGSRSLGPMASLSGRLSGVRC